MAASLFLSAGDHSGDLHAARLVRALKDRVPDLSIAGFGGAALAAEGVEILEPLAADPVMGFRKVAAGLGRFVRLLSASDRWFERRPPTLLVPVDYPGFNVNLAELARRRGIPNLYYLCPQYWAWAPWRGRRLARVVDEAVVLFPFEQRFFQEFGLRTHYLGHPIADRLAEVPAAERDPHQIALLPGSRRQEVDRLLPWMLAAADRLRRSLDAEPRFVSSHPNAEVRKLMSEAAGALNLPLEVGAHTMTEVLSSSSLAIVASGTATLEAALLGVPSIVVYRVSRMLLRLRGSLLTSPFVAQPNLLLGREVFPELVCSEAPAALLADRAARLLGPSGERTQCLQDLAELRQRYLVPGTAERAADLIARRLQRTDFRESVHRDL